MDSSNITDLRARFEWAKQQATEAHRAYNAAADVENKAKAALLEALKEAYGETRDKLVTLASGAEVRLSGYVWLDPEGNLVGRAHDRLKTGVWSRRARIVVTLVPAPKSEVPA